MRIKLILFIFVQYISLMCTFKIEMINSNKTLNQTLFKILHEFFSMQSSISIIFDETTQSLKTTEELLKMFKPNVTSVFDISTVDDKNCSVFHKKTCNIIILTTFSSFLKFSSQINNFNFNFRGFFTVIFQEIEIQQLETIFQFAWNNFMQNFNVISLEIHRKSRLWTFDLFQSGKCGDTSPFLLDFGNKHFKIFANKLKNLRKCPLRVPLFHYSPAVEFLPNSSLSGIEGELLMTVKNILNFSIERVVLGRDEKWGKYLETFKHFFLFFREFS